MRCWHYTLPAAIESSSLSGLFLLSALYKWIILQEGCVYLHNNKIVWPVTITGACSHSPSSAPDQIYAAWIRGIIWSHCLNTLDVLTMWRVKRKIHLFCSQSTQLHRPHRINVPHWLKGVREFSTQHLSHSGQGWVMSPAMHLLCFCRTSPPVVQPCPS